MDELLNNGQLALATDVPLENAHGYFLVRQQKVRHSTRTSNAGTGHWNNAGGRCCQRSL
ncbi:hypothetical protein [Vogesella sp. LIG4]|uniref:hypothetical protein n=1 Tax=Vogesella sp. LIG4 TaxID=1192162 RepID=UPI0012FD5AC3|nr:hypothetical protein [Vogesella sp. LIG4]